LERSNQVDEDEYIYELRKALADARQDVCIRRCHNTWKQGRPQPHHHFCKSITKVLAGKHYDGMYKPRNPEDGPSPEEKLIEAIFGTTKKEQ
jgi:hypothetical protein